MVSQESIDFGQPCGKAESSTNIEFSHCAITWRSRATSGPRQCHHNGISCLKQPCELHGTGPARSGGHRHEHPLLLVRGLWDIAFSWLRRASARWTAVARPSLAASCGSFQILPFRNRRGLCKPPVATKYLLDNSRLFWNGLKSSLAALSRTLTYRYPNGAIRSESRAGPRASYPCGCAP
jgi:hypothetical protein